MKLHFLDLPHLLTLALSMLPTDLPGMSPNCDIDLCLQTST